MPTHRNTVTRAHARGDLSHSRLFAFMRYIELHLMELVYPGECMCALMCAAPKRALRSLLYENWEHLISLTSLYMVYIEMYYINYLE